MEVGAYAADPNRRHAASLVTKFTRNRWANCCTKCMGEIRRWTAEQNVTQSRQIHENILSVNAAKHLPVVVTDKF